jgi:hypothetical protein
MPVECHTSSRSEPTRSPIADSSASVLLRTGQKGSAPPPETVLVLALRSLPASESDEPRTMVALKYGDTSPITPGGVTRPCAWCTCKSVVRELLESR